MNRKVTRSQAKKVPEQHPRRSTRIAALASKASPSKKKNSAKASKLSLGAGTKQKKPVVKRQSRSGPQRKLSSSALQDLNRETINEPLPNALRHWRQNSFPAFVSEDLPSTRSSKMSTYDKNLPEQLTRRGIFDETLLPDPSKPKNLLAIQDALLASPSSSGTIPPSEEEIRDYSVYCQIITSVGILENDLAARAFQPFFDVPLQVPEPHARGGKQQWGETPKPEIQQRPKPDYFEGLSSLMVSEWVEKHLGPYARPVAGIAFPNFLVEHKSEGSMKLAHTQCRLDGALAARGYYELHGLYGDPGVVLNTALVGTVEFNGECFVA
ncbi:uncharacterized protein LY89DRAFT_3964 [Mollisia scopiformis]|uniref:Uncharacterized protein n=1 Tax=Mollisia scopiformis TaxID=149040 RepID=A0A194XU27_MOLSC|nr:uncharacterized protein LY89DRAFT_3964 [Mollisia scopiformis]KUJ23825.1 hypothetical protein LY89DRAFT_3964 [Mollisia scopiformis]